MEAAPVEKIPVKFVVAVAVTLEVPFGATAPIPLSMTEELAFDAHVRIAVCEGDTEDGFTDIVHVSA